MLFRTDLQLTNAVISSVERIKTNGGGTAQQHKGKKMPHFLDRVLEREQNLAMFIKTSTWSTTKLIDGRSNVGLNTMNLTRGTVKYIWERL